MQAWKIQGKGKVPSYSRSSPFSKYLTRSFTTDTETLKLLQKMEVVSFVNVEAEH